MVALPPPRPGAARTPPARSGDPLSGPFLAWRRLLTRLIRGTARLGAALAGSRPVRTAAAAARYLRDPAGTLAAASTAERSLLKEAGAAALVLGVALSFAVPAAVGAPTVHRFLAAGWTAAWALARLFVMRTVARGPLAARPDRIDDAWGPALLPYALAVIDPLPLAALAASAFLTLRGLDGLGVERGEARRTVGIAFGGQLVFELLAWLARGGLLYALVAARG